MKTKKTKWMIATAILFTLFGAACKKSADNSTPYPQPATTAAVTGVQVTADAKFGNILTDNNGRSLYFFSKDVAGATTCVDGCAVTWPVFYKENPVIGAGLNASDFAVITRPDGSKQTSYKGWPLYYFMNDSKAGDTKGDNVANLWAIAKPDYSVMFGNAQLLGLDSVKYGDQGVAGVGASQYLTDDRGRTLYLFSLDSAGKNKFTKADYSNNKAWPIDSVTTVGAFPTLLDKTQFKTIDVAGRKQLVYRGHPMYFFGQDAATRGNTKGVSFPTPGAGIWKVQTSNIPILY